MNESISSEYRIEENSLKGFKIFKAFLTNLT